MDKISDDGRLAWIGETETDASQMVAALSFPGTGHNNRGRANGLRRSHERSRGTARTRH